MITPHRGVICFFIYCPSCNRSQPFYWRWPLWRIYSPFRFHPPEVICQPVIITLNAIGNHPVSASMSKALISLSL
jgi:hypothetical protein